MNHSMKLNPAPYAAIKTGKKNIELRLNDEKRQLVNVGDTITFSNTAIPDLKLYTRVKALHHAPSFSELFTAIPLSVCGFAPDLSEAEAANEMRNYYSEEEENRYGALGIEVELIDQNDDWTKSCNKVDIPAFMKRIDLMKCGEESICPFCGGNVRMNVSEDNHTVFACDCCDMNIEVANENTL